MRNMEGPIVQELFHLVFCQHKLVSRALVPNSSFSMLKLHKLKNNKDGQHKCNEITRVCTPL